MTSSPQLRHPITHTQTTCHTGLSEPTHPGPTPTEMLSGHLSLLGVHKIRGKKMLSNQKLKAKTKWQIIRLKQKS